MVEPISEILISNDSLHKSDKFILLAQKHGLFLGSEVSIKKIITTGESSVGIGGVLSGTIYGDIGLGKPLFFSNKGEFAGNTSGITDSREKDGHLQLLTQSGSVYEVSSKIEEGLEKYIKRHLDEQPNTTRDIINHHQELFVLAKKIDNKIWFFTANYDGKIMALVNSDEEPNIFHPRFFRMSGSDHQFKSCPGYRSNNREVLKGKEDEKDHHYVQSAKLDSRIILTLQELPKRYNDNKRKLISDYMPIMADLENGINGRNLEDFKFSEEQVIFKNENWQKIKEQQKRFSVLYEYLNSFVDNKTVKNFYKTLNNWANYFGVNTQKLIEITKSIPNKNNQWIMEDIFSSNDLYLIKFRNELTQVAEGIVEKIFENQKMQELMEKSSFIPDFNQKPIKQYIKTDGKNNIKVEVFENKSPEGDVLYWEMAIDNKGRTYIDNIYDPRVGIDSYGTPKKKTNMGMLIYKPEDYDIQVAFIPKKYTKDLGNYYVDISRLIELSEPVKKYKMRLRY